MSVASGLPTRAYRSIYGAEFVWNTIWDGAGDVIAKSTGAFDLSALANGGLLRDKNVISIRCINANTDCAGGSGTYTAPQKEAVGLPVSVVSLDKATGNLELARVGVLTSDGGVASDDVDGSARYEIHIIDPVD